jgi:molybdopterin synthase catalytic subunit
MNYPDLPFIHLSHEPLDFAALEYAVRLRSKGAHVFFSGTPRDKKDLEAVSALIFEAYEPMALAELQKIHARAIEVFRLEVAYVHHRLGNCGIQEHAVLVGVGAPHRRHAFEACMWIMDELKSRVPIWKKEVLANGSFYVTPHP